MNRHTLFPFEEREKIYNKELIFFISLRSLSACCSVDRCCYHAVGVCFAELSIYNFRSLVYEIEKYVPLSCSLLERRGGKAGGFHAYLLQKICVERVDRSQ